MPDSFSEIQSHGVKCVRSTGEKVGGRSFQFPEAVSIEIRQQGSDMEFAQGNLAVLTAQTPQRLL